MSELRTDFKDDVLDVTQNERRKYRIIHNEDGTISLEDATAYLQQGDSFGANDLNEMNRMANQMNEAAGEILTMADDIDALQDDVENITPRVETLENRPTTLLCAESEVLFKEVECEISLPSAIANDYTNYVYRMRDMLYYDGKLYLLIINNSEKLILYVYDGASWTSVELLASGGGGAYATIQELNGGIYISYSSNKSYWMLCKYENGAIVEISKISESIDLTSYLVKDYENNILYWIRAMKNSNNNYPCYYQSFDGNTLGNIVQCYSGNYLTLYGAHIQNNKLQFLTMNGSSNYSIIETSLTDGSRPSYYNYIQFDATTSKRYGITKNIKGVLLSCPFDQNSDFFIYRNNVSYKGITDIFRSGVAFTECDDGMMLIDVSYKLGVTSKYMTLKKFKTYKKLYTYGKSGDILQCGDSFAISDNLEPIENGYRVTADGNVEIGVYL